MCSWLAGGTGPAPEGRYPGDRDSVGLRGGGGGGGEGSAP